MKKKNRPIQQAVLLPNREAVNSAQVAILLSIAQSMVGCLRQPTVEIGQDQPAELDGTAKMALEATIIKACARLDTLLAESTRWTFEAQQAMEKQVTSMYEQNTNLLRAQTRLAEEAIKPHARYRPKLYRINETWTAVLGDVNDIDNAICGIGTTPQEAMDAFDGFFTGQIPQHLVNWLRAVEEAHRHGNPEPPLFKNEKTNQSVDGTGTGTPPPAQGDGDITQDDSSDDGPDQDGRRPPGGSIGSDGAI